MSFVYEFVNYFFQFIITARSEMRKVLFLVASVCAFLFVCEISREPLNGFAPNPHGRHVWSLARTSLKVKVKVRSPGSNTVFSALSAACVRFVFGKTSLASSFKEFFVQQSAGP